MKQIKDYIGKEVAIHCKFQEEWDGIVKLISEVKSNNGPTQKYLYNNSINRIVDCLNLKMEGNQIGTSSKSHYQSNSYTVFPASDFLEFQLPKCFYIKRNDVVDEWLSKLSNGLKTYYSDTRKDYPYFIIEDLKYTGGHYRKDTTKSYPEITFEQFQKYVLKENSSDILEQCEKKYLPGTKYKCAKTNNLGEVKGDLFKGSSQDKVADGWGGYVYYNGKFAEIVEETRFKIGKWYKYTRENIIQPSYAKYSSKQSVSDRFYYDEFISVNGYKKGHNWSFLSVKPVLLTDLSEIQQYLPEGHVDKIKSIPEYVEYINKKDSSWKFGKIYKVNGDGTVTFECGSKFRDKSYTTNTTFFKPSTKEAYEAQFVKESDEVLSKSNFKWFAIKVEAEPHEIPKQTEKEYLKQESIGNYPATKNECVSDLKIHYVSFEDILGFPTANRIIHLKKKQIKLTELEIPKKLKIFKR